MTKPVTLFGRKMRKVQTDDGTEFRLSEAIVWQGLTGMWRGEGFSCDATRRCTTPHAAARALERKIVAAHRRLGKLMGIGGGR